MCAKLTRIAGIVRYGEIHGYVCDTRESRRVHGTRGRGCGDDDVKARRNMNAECDDVCECEWSDVAEGQGIRM